MSLDELALFITAVLSVFMMKIADPTLPVWWYLVVIVITFGIYFLFTKVIIPYIRDHI